MPWRRVAAALGSLAMVVASGMQAAAASPGGDASREAGRMACGDAPRPPVRLHLIDRAGLSTDARAELMHETLAPWRGITVLAWADALPTQPAGLGEPKDLYVFVEADAGEPAPETAADRHLPMASILFVNGQPTTHVTVHAGHVARRLASMRIDDLPFADRPRLIRERVLGRVLGRAVAHEVGHFLSGSHDHTPAGLMRASHRIDHLMAPDHPMFHVIAPATPGCLVARDVLTPATRSRHAGVTPPS